MEHILSQYVAGGVADAHTGGGGLLYVVRKRIGICAALIESDIRQRSLRVIGIGEAEIELEIILVAAVVISYRFCKVKVSYIRIRDACYLVSEIIDFGRPVIEAANKKYTGKVFFAACIDSLRLLVKIQAPDAVPVDVIIGLFKSLVMIH